LSLILQPYSNNSAADNNDIFPVKSYSNAESMKEQIFKDLKGESGIYRWVNNVNGKSYVGSSVNFSIRLAQHYNCYYSTSPNVFKDVIRLYGSNPLLQYAMKKYGLDKFSIEILEFCDKGDCIEREQFYLDTLQPEYNLNPLANSRLGAKHSEETRQNMSKARTGFKPSDETRSKMSELKKGSRNHFFGCTHSDDTRRACEPRGLGSHVEK
jgi:group I intron endonuclease